MTLQRPDSIARSDYPSTEAWARAVIVEAHYRQFGRGPTLLEAQFAQAVARGESHYGRGWKDAGVGSHNWGAVQAGRPPCNPDTAFPYGDTHEDGEPYAACFRRYPSDVDGAAHFQAILWRANTRAEANAGNIDGFSKAMRANRYYELRQDLHTKALTRNLQVITQALGEPMPSGNVSGSGLLLLAGAAGIGWLAYRYLR